MHILHHSYTEFTPVVLISRELDQGRQVDGLRSTFLKSLSTGGTDDIIFICSTAVCPLTEGSAFYMEILNFANLIKLIAQ